jgi:hypothetical protein
MSRCKKLDFLSDMRSNTRFANANVFLIGVHVSHVCGNTGVNNPKIASLVSLHIGLADHGTHDRTCHVSRATNLINFLSEIYLRYRHSDEKDIKPISIRHLSQWYLSVRLSNSNFRSSKYRSHELWSSRS